VVVDLTAEMLQTGARAAHDAGDRNVVFVEGGVRGAERRERMAASPRAWVRTTGTPGCSSSSAG
jgi:hypothetical protein